MNQCICLFVGIFLLSGCSPESSFLQSMNGRWSQDEQAFNLHSVDGKLVMLDDAGSIMVITPSGKFDSANKLMTVKFNLYTNYHSETELMFAIAGYCSMSNDIPSCITSPKTKEYLHNGTLGNLILFNASKSPEKEFKFGAKGDDGEVIYNSGFVRQLSAEEQKEIASYSEKVLAINTFIDKAFDKVIAEEIDKKVKSKAKAEEAEKQEQIEKQLRQDRIGSYYMNVGEYGEYYEANDDSERTARWKQDSERKAKWKQDEIEKLGFKTFTEKLNGKILVRIGPYKERDQAEEVVQQMKKQGFHGNELDILGPIGAK